MFTEVYWWCSVYCWNILPHVQLDFVDRDLVIELDFLCFGCQINLIRKK